MEVLVGCGGKRGGDGYGGGDFFHGRLLGGVCGVGDWYAAGWDFWRVGLGGIGGCQVSAL